MIKRGEIQRNDSIDFLDNLDFDFFKNDNVHSNSIVDDDVPFVGGATQHQPFSQGAQNPTLLQQHNPNEFSFDQQFDDDVQVGGSRYPSNDVPSYNNFGVVKKANSGDGASYSSNHYVSRPRNASIDSLVSFMSRRDSYDIDAMNPDGQSDSYMVMGDTQGRKSAQRGQSNTQKHSSGSSRSRPSGASQQSSGNGKFANVFDDDSEASYFQQFQNMQQGDFRPFESVPGKSTKSDKALTKAQQKQQATAVLKSSLLKPGETWSDDGGQVDRQRAQGEGADMGAAGVIPGSFILGIDGISGDGTNAGHGAGGAQSGGFMFSNGDQSSPPQGSAFIGVYSAEARKQRIERFLEKRNRRVWTKRVKYDVRKNFADSRIRVKGRFVKKEDEDLLRVIKDINEEN